jgi:hypothetical protein
LITYLTAMESRLGARLDTGLASVRGEFRSELGDLRGEVRTLDVLVEHLDGRVQVLAEVVQAQGEQHERHHAEIWTELSSLNQRFTHPQARVLRPGDPS